MRKTLTLAPRVVPSAPARPARQHPPPAPRVRAEAPAAPSDGAATRLNKRLADLGHCSRREADDWIAKGWVRVNGQVAQMGQTVVAGDQITGRVEGIAEIALTVGPAE